MRASVGARFGMRVVTGIAPPEPYDTGLGTVYLPQVHVRCDCGVESVIKWTMLKSGRSKACRSCSAKNRELLYPDRWLNQRRKR